MATRIQQHLYPIIEIMVAEAVRDIEKDGKKISCRAGCSHCCYLLVEISWPEAMELAHWVLKQPKQRRQQLIQRIEDNAAEARTLFSASKKDVQYCGPVLDSTAEISQKSYDRYFFEKKRPCPLLEDGCCSAYPVRPSTCRMHMVTSPPELCSDQVRDEEGYELPDRIDQLREEVGPMNSAVGEGQGWGHLGVMVATALEQIQATK